MRRPLVLLATIALTPLAARAQSPASVDTSSLIARDSAHASHATLVAALERVPLGKRIRVVLRDSSRFVVAHFGVVADSLVFVHGAHARYVAFGDIDAFDVEGAHAGWMLGALTGAPCALYGAFMASYPFSGGDSGGPRLPGLYTLGAIGGAAAGFAICGAPGYALGRRLNEWRPAWRRRSP